MLRLIEVCGDSMKPTLKDGEFCIIDTSKTAIKDIRIGNVIVFRLKSCQRNWQHNEEYAVKRVSGIKKIANHKQETQLWVLGDNAINSYDSRKYGYISSKQVIGIVTDNTHQYSKIKATKYLFAKLYAERTN